MSIGFHYYETVNQSLTLQWVNKEDTPGFMGQVVAWRSAAALLGYGSIWVFMGYLKLDYQWMYFIIGLLGLLMVIVIALYFPQFEQKATQQKKIFLKQRYWLFYWLTFLSGARRQIFMVFAGFMMVEKFGYSVSHITSLFLINYVVNLFFAPAIGRLIGRIGERRTLMIEYAGLIAVFVGYALVEHPMMAGVLYVIDHLLFAMAIALKTYFQKIADSKDISATMSVSFSINHIAAVFLPILLGMLWLHSPDSVFYIGAGIAVLSLLSAFNIPRNPSPGNEFAITGKSTNRNKVDDAIKIGDSI